MMVVTCGNHSKCGWWWLMVAVVDSSWWVMARIHDSVWMVATVDVFSMARWWLSPGWLVVLPLTTAMGMLTGTQHSWTPVDSWSTMVSAGQRCCSCWWWDAIYCILNSKGSWRWIPVNHGEWLEWYWMKNHSSIKHLSHLWKLFAPKLPTINHTNHGQWSLHCQFGTS